MSVMPEDGTPPTADQIDAARLLREGRDLEASFRAKADRQRDRENPEAADAWRRAADALGELLPDE